MIFEIIVKNNIKYFIFLFLLISCGLDNKEKNPEEFFYITDREINEIRRLELGTECPEKEGGEYRKALTGDTKEIRETRLPFMEASIRNPISKANVITGEISGTFLNRRGRDVEIYAGMTPTKI